MNVEEAKLESLAQQAASQAFLRSLQANVKIPQIDWYRLVGSGSELGEAGRAGVAAAIAAYRHVMGGKLHAYAVDVAEPAIEASDLACDLCGKVVPLGDAWTEVGLCDRAHLACVAKHPAASAETRRLARRQGIHAPWDFSMIPGVDIDKLFRTCIVCMKPIWSGAGFGPYAFHDACSARNRDAALAAGAANDGSNPSQATMLLDEFALQHGLELIFSPSGADFWGCHFVGVSVRIGATRQDVRGWGRTRRGAVEDYVGQLQHRTLVLMTPIGQLDIKAPAHLIVGPEFPEGR